MATQLKSKCPKCGAVFRADETLVGKRVRCPKCQGQFELTQVQFSPSSPSLDQAPQANETIAPASSDTSRSPDLFPPSYSARKPADLGKLGRFELRELLGQGAFGRVYKAYDPRLDRFVAIKVPTFGLEDKQKLKRFIAEAKAAARLRHPNIVPVFDSGSDQGQLFIASAFIEGQTLADRIEVDRPDFRESARLVMALASGLDSAHRQGVVHRDVKPANIMLDSEGVPLLMDFGLAQIRESGDKLTHDGSVLGTPAYMSPEQATGKLDQVGPASDQYSLGVIFYELITSKQPFSGAAAVVISQVISQDPALPTAADSTIPRDLEAICLKAMSKDASKRYASCQALADDLSRWLASESTHPPASVVAPRFAPWRRRQAVAEGFARLSRLQRILSIGTVIGVVVISALASAIYWFASDFGQSQSAPAQSAVSGGGTSPHGANSASESRPAEAASNSMMSKSISEGAQLRQRWVRDNSEFKLLASGLWQETSNSGDVWRYQEITRNEEFIEIDALTGHLAIRYRLYSTRCDIGYKPNLNFKFMWAGKWMPEVTSSGFGQIGTNPIGKQLLVNPGCEEPITLQRIPGWSVIRGNWFPSYSIPAREGSYHFRTGKSADSELRQDISIQAATSTTNGANLKYNFSGYVQSYRQNPGDTARIIVECRDTNLQVLNKFDSGAIAHFGGWKEIAASRTLPAGTEIIRVRLITQRRGKGTQNNDAWFDALSLRFDMD